MSLQVWLPLNGNVNNQGICDTIQADSAPKYTIGTIGQRIDLSKSVYFSGLPKLENFSIFFWAKVDSCTVTWSDLIGFTSKQANDSNAADFRFEATVDTRACSWHNNSPYAISSGTRILIQNYNEWHHVGVVYDGEKIYSYIDGELRYTDTGLGGYLTTSFHIGQTGYIVGALNDLRIYDNCLSKSEVKQIAKACVLHYNFEDVVVPYQNLRYNEGFSLYNNEVATGDSKARAEASLVKLDETYMNSPIYRLTMSTDNDDVLRGLQTSLFGHGIASSSPRTTFEPNIPQSYGVLYRNVTHKDCVVGGTPRNVFDASWIQATYFKDGWYRVGQTRINKTDKSGTDNWYTSFKCESLKLNEEIIIDFCQEEQYNNIDFLPERVSYEKGMDKTIYDSSGYGHNGLLSGEQYNAIFRPSTIEGSHCLEFIGDPACYIDTGKIFYDDTNQCHTVCAWVYRTDNQIGGQELINWNYGYRLKYYNNSSPNSELTILYINDGENNCYTYGNTIPLNSWHHIAYVFDRNNNIKNIYLDGELDNYVTVGDSSKITPSGINKDTYIGVRFKGYLDDIRIYATALSQDDIKELYQLRGRIDNNNNLLIQNVNEPSNMVAVEVEDALIQGKENNRLYLYAGNNQYRKAELIDGKVHLWRSPNNTNSGNSAGNYTGFVVRNLKDLLEKDHVYLFSFDIEGFNDSPENANASLVYTIGWGGCGGLKYYTVSSHLAHFDGKEKLFFLYDLRGKELWQAATKTEGSIVAGTYYPIYNNFFFRFNYSQTGEKGTDVYISNISMQDITDNINVNIDKKYIINGCDFEENESLEKSIINKNNQIIVNKIIET